MFFRRRWRIVVMTAVMGRSTQLTGIDIQTVLSFLGEAKMKWKKLRKFEIKWFFLPGLSIICPLLQTYFIINVTISSNILCVTYLESFFSSMPFLCSVAIKSVSGRDIRNCKSKLRPANIRGSCKNIFFWLKIKNWNLKVLKSLVIPDA